MLMSKHYFDLQASLETYPVLSLGRFKTIFGSSFSLADVSACMPFALGLSVALSEALVFPLLINGSEFNDVKLSFLDEEAVAAM